MKYTLLMSALLIAAWSSATEPNKLCSLCIEPTWDYLDDSQQKHFNDRWILVGSIIFKKKCAEPIVISKVHLQWQGQHIEQLHASLYIKKDEAFMPIEENLVCDGRWNTVKQKLILQFEKPYKLGVETTFYLVLTVPEELETIVRHGSFSVIPHCLPTHVQQVANKENLVLSFASVTSSPIH